MALTKLKLKKLAYEHAKIENKKFLIYGMKKKIAEEDWLKGFCKRMGDLSLRKPESTSLARAMAFNPFNVHAFLTTSKAFLATQTSLQLRIWNLDETGINTVPNSRHILCRTGTKQVGQIRSGKRGLNITMCCCVIATGMALTPAFKFPRVRFASHMLRRCSCW